MISIFNAALCVLSAGFVGYMVASIKSMILVANDRMANAKHMGNIHTLIVAKDDPGAAAAYVRGVLAKSVTDPTVAQKIPESI